MGRPRTATSFRSLGPRCEGQSFHVAERGEPGERGIGAGQVGGCREADEFRLGVFRRIRPPRRRQPETFVLEHGYCRSVYIKDPNGMLLEFTLDAPNADQIAKDRKADAHATLKRWLAGDHTSNNMYR